MKRLKRKSLPEQVKEVAKKPIEKEKPLRFDKIVSTGSTILDLAISGGRVRGGGIPGGILLEIFGPSASGKTAVLAEICSSAQSKGGQVKFQDGEAKLDKEYARIYGLSLKESGEDYSRPQTVNEMFDEIDTWKPKNSNVLNVIGSDSLAALSTELEMESSDKMGMKRAKDFSERTRKCCKLITEKNWIIACTNQIRQGTYGEFVPGGNAIPYYAQLRMRIKEIGKVTKTTKTQGRSQEKTKGIESECYIKKSDVDDPYRTATPIFIIFGYGIDDIRGNLQWLKDNTGTYDEKTKKWAPSTMYNAIDKEYQVLDAAVGYIERMNYENELKEKVIDLWEEIEEKFKVDRKPKVR